MLVWAIFCCGQRLTYGVILNFKCLYIQKYPCVHLNHRNLDYMMRYKLQTNQTLFFFTLWNGHNLWTLLSKFTWRCQIILKLNNTDNCHKLCSNGETLEKKSEKEEFFLLQTLLLENILCHLLTLLFFFWKMKGHGVHEVWTQKYVT